MTMSHLWGIVGRNPSGHKLMVFDCCCPGKGLLAPGGMQGGRWQKLVRQYAAQILCASAPDRVAYEKAEYERSQGVFTKYLVSALSGKAFADKEWITLETIAEWVNERVLKKTRNEQSVHHGYINTRTKDKGKAIFVKPGVQLYDDGRDKNIDEEEEVKEDGVASVVIQSSTPPDRSRMSDGSGGVLEKFLWAVFNMRDYQVLNDHAHAIRIRSEKKGAFFAMDSWSRVPPKETEQIRRSSERFTVEIKCAECNKKWTGLLTEDHANTTVARLTK